MNENINKLQKELLELWDGTEKIYTRILKKFNLSGNAFTVLYLLLTHSDGLEPAQLAERLGGMKQIITPLLNDLEKHGYILRREQKKDHRKKLILLSRRGIAFAEEVCEAVYRVDRQALELFTTEEQNLLLDFSRRYFNAIKDFHESR